MRSDLSSFLLPCMLIIILTSWLCACEGGRLPRKKMPELAGINDAGERGRGAKEGTEAADFPFTIRDTLLLSDGTRSRFLAVSLSADAADDSAVMSLVNSYKPWALPLLSGWAGKGEKGVLVDLRPNTENATDAVDAGEWGSSGSTGHRGSGYGEGSGSPGYGTVGYVDARRGYAGYGTAGYGTSGYRAEYILERPGAFSISLILCWDPASARRAAWCLETLQSLSFLQCNRVAGGDMPGGTKGGQDCFQPAAPCLDCQ